MSELNGVWPKSKKYLTTLATVNYSEIEGHNMYTEQTDYTDKEAYTSILRGEQAIEYAEAHGLTLLHTYHDDHTAQRDTVSLKVARKMAMESPYLVFIEVPRQYDARVDVACVHCHASRATLEHENETLALFGAAGRDLCCEGA